METHAVLPGAPTQHGRRPSNTLLLYFAAAVVVYACYVVLLVAPQAREELLDGMRWARQVSDMRWRRTDHWTEVARERMDSTGGKLQQQVHHLGHWMRTTERALEVVTTELHDWLGRAFASKKVVEHHVGEFHGFGDAERARFCVVAVEPADAAARIAEPPPPLLQSLLRQSSLERQRFALYWASTADSAELRHHYQSLALSSHVAIERIVCPDVRNATELLNCAAERCFADLHDYIYAAHALVELQGHKWARSVAAAFKARGDLGAVEVAAVVQAGLLSTVVLSRAHMRVFGATLIPPSMELTALAAFVRVVYGVEFHSALPLHKASVSLSDARVLGGASVIDATLQSAATFAWRMFLCRHKLWTRYCSAADVAHYAKQPSHHANHALTRAELESMESAAKKGHVADMDRILEAQRRAQEQALERRARRKAVKHELMARLRTALKPPALVRSAMGECDMLTREIVSQVMADREVVDFAISLLHAGQQTPWAALFSMSLRDITEATVSHVTRHRAAFDLRWAVEEALQGKAVLPDAEGALRATVVTLLAEMGAPWTRTPAADADLGVLREAFVQAFAALRQRWTGDALVNASNVPRLLRTATDAPTEVPTVPPDGIFPCVVDGQVIPYPWISRRVSGEMSSECFANKTLGEKCCDYKDTAQPDWCVARFQGYGSDAARQWMQHCRSAAWVDTPAQQSLELQQRKEAQQRVGPVVMLGPGQMACRVAGVTLPPPWYRSADMPERVCRAPKLPAPPRERCCDYNKPEPYCEAIFQGYSAADVRGWVQHCRMPYWGAARE